VALPYVVEVGALNRCGDIVKRRSGASRLLEGAGREHDEGGLTPAVKSEPVCVLEYLAARISHLSRRVRLAG